MDKSAPAENLGQVVFGERIRPSPYEISFLKDAGKCKTVCTKEYDSSKKEDVVKLDFLKKGMSMNYQHHWIVDNMPVNLIRRQIISHKSEISRIFYHKSKSSLQ